jgi:hypothetical protein
MRARRGGEKSFAEQARIKTAFASIPHIVFVFCRLIIAQRFNAGISNKPKGGKSR